jgi:xanthine dehydrogenase accessory factor
VTKDLELWQFIAERLDNSVPVILLVVAESRGSSPGRPGYKMAVDSYGNLIGSIGGGVMEVNLVERSRARLSEPGAVATGLFPPQLIEQVHKKNSPHSSGMICSGRQTVIMRVLMPNQADRVCSVIDYLVHGLRPMLLITPEVFAAGIPECPAEGTPAFERASKTDFTYSEVLGPPNDLFIIGGGHCSLALSELMSKLDFRITIFDDRPELNTIEKNRFAHEIRIIESYENIGDLVTEGPDVYVVIMTIGYASDEIAIRGLLDKEIKYLGVLGSSAKMKVLLKSLEKEGIDARLLSRIHTPIGLPINSHSPEEIAVSIAAEIISVKNA